MAVCVLPGTELSLANEVICLPTGLLGRRYRVINHKTAIFRQINKQKIAAHHDALEFPDGQIVLLTVLCEGQQATVLQLPAEPKTAVEAQIPAARSLYRLTIRGQNSRWWPPVHFGTSLAANRTYQAHGSRWRPRSP